MNVEGARKGWYPDPDDPAYLRRWDGTTWVPPAPTSPTKGRATPFGRTFLWGVMIGLLTGGVTGTLGVPVIGTVIGVIAGLIVGVPFALFTALAIDKAVRSAATVQSYRRAVDLTLLVLGVATAVVAMFTSTLFGYYLPIAMVVIAVACLLVVRPWLRRFVR